MSTTAEKLMKALGTLPVSAEDALRRARGYLDSGFHGKAVAAAIVALDYQSDLADAWLTLGIASRYLRAYDRAASALSRAMELQPASAQAAKAYAVTLYERGDYELALDGFRRAQQLAPNDPAMRWLDLLAHPKFPIDETQARAATARFAQGLERAFELCRLHPHWPEALQVAAWITPFHLHYYALDLEALSRRFGDLLALVTAMHAPALVAPIEPRRPQPAIRRRLGFVCSALREHTLMRYFANWLLQLDSNRFETWAWNLGTTVDTVSEEIQARGVRIYHVGTQDVAQIARSIRDAGLDVLVHLDVGMDGRTCLLAAMRLASVQCATYGHPVTTGSSRIDYFLSADALEPVDADAHYRERLVRLPGLGTLPRRPRGPVGDAAWLPRESGRPLMLCIQNLIKIVPEFDPLAARIAARSGAVIVFFEHEPAMADRFRKRMQRVCATAGIDFDAHFRIVRTQPYAEYLGGIAAADLVLDSIHFSGGSTSLDALSLGTPLVTLEGTRMRGRQTAGMLRMLGVDELIAKDADGYVDLAVNLAGDRARRDDLRRRLLAVQDRLFSDARVMPALENFLDTVEPPDRPD